MNPSSRTALCAILPLLALGVFADAACAPGSVDGGSNAADGGAEGATAAYCDTNAQCIDTNGSETFVCNKVSHACVNLLSADCPTLLADPGATRDDDVAIFGLSLFPSLAPGLASAANAVELARSDFQNQLGGLPRNQGKPRPIVFVSCDSSAGAAPSTDAIDGHLFDEVGVPAALGFPIDGLVASDAQAAAKTGALVFGFTPADQGLSAYVGGQGSYVASALDGKTAMLALAATSQYQIDHLSSWVPSAPNPSDMKVVLVLPSDGPLMENAGEYRGSQSIPLLHVDEVTVGSATQSASPAAVASAVTKIVDFAPDLIACAGPSCGALAGAVEKARPAKMGFAVTSLDGIDVSAFPTANDRARVLRPRFGRPTNDPLASTLRARLLASFPDAEANEIVPVAWDIAHAALLAAIPSDTFKGTVIGASLRSRFHAGGQLVAAGDLHAAAAALLAGYGIDYRGAAFDLRYDATGVLQAPAVALDCLAAQGAAGDSGLTYDATAGLLEGTLVACP